MVRKLVSYRLADDLQEALKTRASSEGISATELVNRLLRQGLTDDTPDAKAAIAVQQRVSQLEQLVHQLERRVAPDGAETALAKAEPTATALAAQLLALEQKIDTLSAGVAEGCRSLQQLQATVQGAASQGPGWPTPEPNTYPVELSSEVVQLPLAALRKLLSSDPAE